MLEQAIRDAGLTEKEKLAVVVAAWNRTSYEPEILTLSEQALSRAATDKAVRVILWWEVARLEAEEAWPAENGVSTKHARAYIAACQNLRFELMAQLDSAGIEKPKGGV